jgi:hypothetical protein
MRKAARETAIVALVIAFIAIATGVIRLASHALDSTHGRISQNRGLH